MATIVNAYDLSGGDTLSTEIVAPNNVRIQYEVTGATSSQQVIWLTLQVNDGTAYVDAKDENGRNVRFPVSGNAKASENFAGINSASAKVKVEATNCDGSLTITSYES